MTCETIMNWFVGLGAFPIIAIVSAVIILKGMALWYAARAKQKAWFICLLILNTLGLLPLIYLAFFKKRGT